MKKNIAERCIRTLKSKIYRYMTSVSKNVYINKSDDIVNKYNNTYNTYHSKIKMNPVDVKSSTYIDSIKEIDDEILNLKLVTLLEYQYIKTSLQKAMFQIGLKNFLSLKKLKRLYRRHILLVILLGKKLFERLTKKNCKKQIKKSLDLKK